MIEALRERYVLCRCIHNSNNTHTQPLPSNIFLVAACNPHRGNSLDVHGYREDLEVPVHNIHQDGPKEEMWFRGSYYVHKLHPTLKLLMWNYGSLNDEQEADYIEEKMNMVNADFDKFVCLFVLSVFMFIYKFIGYRT